MCAVWNENPKQHGLLGGSDTVWMLYSTSNCHVPKVSIMVQVHWMGGSMNAMCISGDSTMWDCLLLIARVDARS